MEGIALETLREFPIVQQHFASMSYDEAFVDGGDLAARGLPRLPDEELSLYAATRSRLLATSDAQI